MLGVFGDFIALFFLGAAVILITRYLLIEGIQYTSDAWHWPQKVRGQVFGYATSVPELVGTVGTASKGLLGAGLWNIAASNIINLTLFVVALLYYRRGKQLIKVKFADEVGFSLGAIAIPAALVLLDSWAESPWTALGLFLFFISYLVVDQWLNSEGELEEEPGARGDQGIKGITLILAGLIGIVIAGNYLGIVAESIVVNFKVPEWAVGWILGAITSLPELTTFFAVFAAGKDSPDDKDCQESLDNLAASNMSNLGLIYPIGIMVYLFCRS
jgi:Ca2+/Na+ antiporter